MAIAPVDTLLCSVATAERSDSPYTYWQLRGVLPEELRRALIALPVGPPENYGEDTYRREQFAGGRLYFGPEVCRQYPAAAEACELFSTPEAVAAFEVLCGIRLRGSYLRVGYHVDADGFWLEPHLDLGVKRLTVNIYLDKTNSDEELGTDIYVQDAVGQFRRVYTLGNADNCAMVFVPADNTWHGFEPRHITGERKVLIVNFVTDEWRNRGELYKWIP